MIKETFKGAGYDWFNKDFHNRIKWMNIHIGSAMYSFEWHGIRGDDVTWSFKSTEDEVFCRLAWGINEYSRT